jgi:hypothetical protein
MAETIEGVEELMDVVIASELEFTVRRRLLRVLGQVATMLEAPPKVQLPVYTTRNAVEAGSGMDDGNSPHVGERAFLPPERVTGNPLVAQK